MITIAICTYNGEKRLPGLVAELEGQQSPLPFEILIVDNNSTDNTPIIIEQLKEETGISLRSVVEENQGIPFARNRAIEESLESDYLYFIDDDEIPYPDWISSACKVFEKFDAKCVGGRICCRFKPYRKPIWLNEELLGFLGEIDHGQKEFQILNQRHPIWSGNIAYDTSLFKDNRSYRFDHRYNRKGKGIGGGSDGLMFRRFIDDGVRMAYCPGMVIDHYIEAWKLKQSYFYRLHFIAGRKFGQYQTGEYETSFLGVPNFMMGQAMGHLKTSLLSHITNEGGRVRKTMNLFYSIGTIYGRILRHIDNKNLGSD